MNINEDFKEIMEYAHFWNWLPDWNEVQKIYDKFPYSYSVLTPFAYSYLEELIRSTTSEYGRELPDKEGNEIKRKVGIDLINKAIHENRDNIEYISILKDMKKYYEKSKPNDCGNNRNSVNHGYLHSEFWSKESFEELIHDIARISKFAGF